VLVNWTVFDVILEPWFVEIVNANVVADVDVGVEVEVVNDAKLVNSRSKLATPTWYASSVSPVTEFGLIAPAIPSLQRLA
jgi:hypothetical protein